MGSLSKKVPDKLISILESLRHRGSYGEVVIKVHDGEFPRVVVSRSEKDVEGTAKK